MSTAETPVAPEERLRAFMEHSPSSIFVKDMEGRYLLVNAQWSRVTGIPAESAIGRLTSDCWPDGPDVIAESERILLAQGKPLVTDERIPTVHGPRDFMVVRFLVRDSGGGAAAMVGIATDITERKQAERELRVRDRLLETVSRASPDIITVLDQQGRVRQVSEAGAKILGYSRDVSSVTKMSLVVHPDDRERVMHAFDALISGETDKVQLRFRTRHAHGHWVTVDSSAQALVDASGEFGGAVVITRDITAAIEDQERLRLARESAEQASAAKSEFLSRMSHELRTPLNSVLGFAQLMHMDELSAQETDAVDHILTAGRHLLDLIDEVLDIARIESGRLELTMVLIPVVEIVADAVELTRPLASRADVSVHVKLDSHCPYVVRADRQRLLQVLLNLLSNAVKYNGPGGRVEVDCIPCGPGRLRLSVADTGRGIRKQDMKRVFEPFDRLGAELAGPEGSGMGLSLSRQLTEHMGGSLDLTSVYGNGSTFYVDLESGADFDAYPVEAGTEGVRARSAASEVFRVLLVEQDPESLDLVEQVLKRRSGAEVIAAMHPRLGLELAREHRPALVLLDLATEEAASSSVLDLFGSDPGTAGIPVAVMGGHADAQEVRELLGRGVVGYLTKPIDVRGLLSLVDAVRAARDC